MPESTQVIEAVLKLRDKFTTGTKRVLSGLQRFGRRARAVFARVGRAVISLRGLMLGLGGALVVRALFRVVTSVADLGDRLGKLSTSTGLTVELLSKLKFAAEQSGSSLESFAKGVSLLQQNIGMFLTRPTGEVADAINVLSDDFRELIQSGADTETILVALVEEFGNLETAIERTFVARKLFGRAGSELIPLLRQGKDGIRELFEQSQRLGIVWRDLEAREAEAFKDALNRIGSSIRGLAENVIKPLLGPFTQLIDKMTEWAVSNRPTVLRFFADLLESMKMVAPAIVAVAGQIAEAVRQAMAPFLDLRGLILEAQIWKVEGAIEKLESQIEKRRKGRQIQFGTGIAGAFPPEEKRYIEERERALEGERKTIAKLSKEYEKVDELRRGLKIPEAEPLPKVPPEDEAAIDQAIRRMRDRADIIEGGGFPSEPGKPIGTLFDAEGVKVETEVVKTQLEKLTGALNGVKQGVADIGQQWGDSFQLARQATQAVGYALADEITYGIQGVLDGTEKIEDAFRKMAKGVLSELQRIITRLIVMRALGGIAGLFRSTPATTGLNTTVDVDPNLRLGSLYSGQSQAGGFNLGALSFERAQHGTAMTRGPTLAGEVPEAVIPLPGNRMVPVQIRGGGGDTYYMVNTIDAKSFDEYFKGSAARQSSFLGGMHARRFQEDRRLRSRYR